MPPVSVREAPAKLNWTLEVVGRRPDGYHDVASVMTTLDLADELSLHPADAWSITVEAPPPLAAELARDNLVARAAALLTAHLTVSVGLVPPQTASLRPPPAFGPPARLHLAKRIPAAAGLGGGSSDAAATLVLLWRRWAVDGPLAASLGGASAAAHLGPLAARVGSDVPFFLDGGVQLAEGRGERLTPLAAPPPVAVVLLTPPIAVERKTARLYGLLTPGDFTDGGRSRDLARRLAAGATVGEGDIVNAFERVAPAAFPGIERYAAALRDATGAPAHLCGAGPSLFALCADTNGARTAAAALRRAGFEAWAVRAPASPS